MPEPPSGTVLVTGATGRQGGAVARALLQRGRSVRGLTRSRTSEPARLLEREGVEVVEGNFDALDTLHRALEGVAAVYGMGTPFEAGVQAEIRQGERLIRAAKAAGVGFFVYASVSDADRNTGIPHFDSKFIVEQYLRQSGLAFTILAPVYFAENLLTVNVLAQLRQGRLSLPLAPDRRLQVIALDDLGRFAAFVFEQPEAFTGQRLNLASDEVTGRQMAQVLSRRVGRPVEFISRPIEQVRAWNPDYAQMFEWLNRIGYSAAIQQLRSRWPETGWRRFEQWAAAQNWSELLGAVEAA